MEITKVWVLSTGCIYEGGGVRAIYSTYDKAREALLKRVEKENEVLRKCNDEDTIEGYERDWVYFTESKHNPNRFTTDVDYIEIDEMEVL